MEAAAALPPFPPGLSTAAPEDQWTPLDQARCQAIVDRVALRPLEGMLAFTDVRLVVRSFRLDVTYRVPDVHEPGGVARLGTGVDLKGNLSLAGLLEAVRGLFAYLVLHELDELLVYDGRAVFNQHGWPNARSRPLWSSIGRELPDVVGYVSDGPARQTLKNPFVPIADRAAAPGDHTRPLRDLTEEEFAALSAITAP